MNLEDWDIYYKYKQANKMRPNLVYVPRINKEQTVFCMDYNIDSKYFFDRPLYNTDTIEFYFNNELRWLEHYKKEMFSPEILEIDKVNRRIFFKWYDKSVNHLIYKKQFDEKHIKSIKNILSILEQSVYKINFYPHTMFVDDNDNIRLHDFYGCISKSNHYLPMDILKPILGKMDVWKFGQFETDGLVNMYDVYKLIFTTNTGDWPFGIQ